MCTCLALFMTYKPVLANDADKLTPLGKLRWCLAGCLSLGFVFPRVRASSSWTKFIL